MLFISSLYIINQVGPIYHLSLFQKKILNQIMIEDSKERQRHTLPH